MRESPHRLFSFFVLRSKMAHFSIIIKCQEFQNNAARMISDIVPNKAIFRNKKFEKIRGNNSLPPISLNPSLSRFREQMKKYRMSNKSSSRPTTRAMFTALDRGFFSSIASTMYRNRVKSDV